MNDCTDIKPIVGCFKPNDGSKPVPVVIHIIYDKDEVAVGQSYSLASDNENLINPATYLGGGVVESGCCQPQQVDQTHTLVTGNGNVPAGLKTVTINNITGLTTINGGYELGNGRRDNSISLSATVLSEARGLLPAITIAGGTWQWIGLQPINEVQ